VAALTCPDCGRTMAVKERDGKRIVLEHECPGPAPGRRQDAPAPPVGSGQGPMRYGQPAGDGTPAWGLPPLALARPRAGQITC
jgi:hypothetical protein